MTTRPRLEAVAQEPAPSHEPTGLVPEVQSWHAMDGVWAVPATLTVHLGPGTETVGEYLASELAARGRHWTTSACRDSDVVLAYDENDATWTTAPTATREEAYSLAVSDSAVLTAASPRGLARAIATLVQLLDLQGDAIPRGSIIDWPDYPVRGFLLDVGRRFVPTATVLDLIHHIARFKLNTFILHLNDNEIVKDTGRSWDAAQHGFRLRSDNPDYAVFASADGSYSREEWEEIETFAAQRGVRIVPEIDGPAHSRAFIASRPDLGLNGGDSDLFDLSTSAAAEFMQELLDEFIPWFQGPWLHFGADEYDPDHAEDYRRYFTAMAEHIRYQGKVPMAWGSLTKISGGAGDLPPQGYDRELIMCSWSNEWYGPTAAVADGYTIINTNDAWLYTVPYADYYCGDGLRLKDLWDGWEPHVFAEGQQIERFHPQLLGAISACWNDLTLHDYTEQDIHDIVVPTFGLMGQKTWNGTPPSTNYEDFTARLLALDGACR